VLAEALLEHPTDLDELLLVDYGLTDPDGQGPEGNVVGDRFPGLRREGLLELLSAGSERDLTFAEQRRHDELDQLQAQP